MIIEKILNNNVVTTIDFNTRKEKVVMGKGVGFKKKVGEEINDEDIEKIFAIEDVNANEKLKKLVNEVPIDIIEAAEETIKIAKEKYSLKVDEHILIALADHLAFAIKRFKENIIIENHLIFEIKRIYAKEFSVGKEAIEIVKRRFEIELPEDEAAFIAMHFVNVSMGENLSEAINATKIVKDILNIIRYYFAIEFHQEDLSYDRLLTHLKFFAQRVVSNNQTLSNEDAFLEIVKEKYTEAYKCVQIIKEYSKNNHSYEATNAEVVYLTMHIQRLINVK